MFIYGSRQCFKELSTTPYTKLYQDSSKIMVLCETNVYLLTFNTGALKVGKYLKVEFLFL